MRKNRSQVLGSLLEDFDKEKYERTLRKEGRQEGYELGRQDERQKMAEIMARQFGLSPEEVLEMCNESNGKN